MKQFCLISILWVFFSCSNLPKEKLKQFSVDFEYTVENDSAYLQVDNHLFAPLLVRATTEKANAKNWVTKHFPLFIPPKTDTVFKFPVTQTKEELALKFSVSTADTARLKLKPVKLPFPKGKTYKIMQGYQGSFSHNKPYSKYALDFTLKKGDTISAVADGYVVGVIKGYSEGGNDFKWRDYANYITLYHPEMHFFTQYVHLKQNGSLVQLNDKVVAGQPIGLSGVTGFTSKEHLHFNAFRNSKGVMEPIEIEFENGIKGKDLKTGAIVKH
ncbi:M23 family metallopeptidase [Jejudonia soesokkakensis]|uniref:M23 family metallopeptidase n=1 Tax=Jejudonia soesokkakensis TaxID=1323432 RepID=A0ABW2MVR2_9FLAO